MLTELNKIHMGITKLLKAEQQSDHYYNTNACNSEKYEDISEVQCHT